MRQGFYASDGTGTLREMPLEHIKLRHLGRSFGMPK
jgi:hypothetical protein